MKPYSEVSYQEQVKRLKPFAKLALRHFKLKPSRVRLIHHGENATFKVIAQGKSYLLRIHRDDYHTIKAINEELDWLYYVKDKKLFNVQSPFRSISGAYVVEVENKQVGRRYCDLLTWREGEIAFDNFTTDKSYKLGRLMTQLHSSCSKYKIKHRNYWDAQGLIGDPCKFGSFKDFKTHYPKFYKRIESIRNFVYEPIDNYIKKNPKKCGMIHGDLHLGNMIWNKGVVTPIDFDDCGFGSFMGDLAVPLNRFRFDKELHKREEELTLQFFAGYNSIDNILGQEDFRMLDYFIIARELLGLMWLMSRSDNLRLKEFLDKNISSRLDMIQKCVENIKKAAN